MARRKRATKEQRSMEAAAEIAEAVPAPVPGAAKAAPAAAPKIAEPPRLKERLTEALERLRRGDLDGNQLTATDAHNVRLALQYHELAGVELGPLLRQLGVDIRKCANR